MNSSYGPGPFPIIKARWSGHACVRQARLWRLVAFSVWCRSQRTTMGPLQGNNKQACPQLQARRNDQRSYKWPNTRFPARLQRPCSLAEMRRLFRYKEHLFPRTRGLMCEVAREVEQYYRFHARRHEGYPVKACCSVET